MDMGTDRIVHASLVLSLAQFYVQSGCSVNISKEGENVEQPAIILFFHPAL